MAAKFLYSKPGMCWSCFARLTDEQVGEWLGRRLEKPLFESWNQDVYAMVYYAASGAAGPEHAQTALTLMRDCLEYYAAIPGLPPEFLEAKEEILATLERAQENNSRANLTSQEIRRRFQAEHHMAQFFQEEIQLPNEFLAALEEAQKKPAAAGGYVAAIVTVKKEGKPIEPDA